MRNVLTYEGVPVPRQEHSRGTRRVVEVDPRTDPRYEAFVVNHPRALIYHHPAWLEVLVRENFVRPICLACEDGGRLTGILPLFATRGLPFGRQLTGRRLSSLPRTPVAGPLALNAGAAAALLRDAKNRAAERPGTQLQIKMASNELDGLVDDIGGSRWRPYYAIELPHRIQDLRFGSSHNHARIRSTVNKAG